MEVSCILDRRKEAFKISDDIALNALSIEGILMEERVHSLVEIKFSDIQSSLKVDWLNIE